MKKTICLMALVALLQFSAWCSTTESGDILITIKPSGTSAGNTGEFRMKELKANGENYWGFKAPDSISSNCIMTTPSGDGTSGQVMYTNASKVLAWGSLTDIAGTATVPKGGSGLTTITSGAYMTGNGTGNVALVGPGTTGQIPISNGSAPVMCSLSGDATLASGGSLTLATVGTGKGGLGITTTPSNGFVPIGNGTNYTAAALSGTSNQVVVTNGSGTITLSTPQSIGTSSTPQFARLGLGAAADGTVPFYVSTSTSYPGLRLDDSGTYAGFQMRRTNTPSAGVSQYNGFIESYGKNAAGTQSATYVAFITDDTTTASFDTHIDFVVHSNTNADPNPNKVASLTSTGVWTNAPCTRAVKTFEGTPAEIWGSVCAKLKPLQIQRWHPKDIPQEKIDKERHVSPDANDWYIAFGVGPKAVDKDGNRGLASMDMAGIALVAAQELIAKNEALEARCAAMEERLAALEKK